MVSPPDVPDQIEIDDIEFAWIRNFRQRQSGIELKPGKQSLVVETLLPGGTLLIGHAESISGFSTLLGLIAPSGYRAQEG